MKESTKKIHRKLFQLIVEENSNDDDILKILQDEQQRNIIAKIIDVPFSDHSQETMLMWAVWNLKKDIVVELIKLGANCFYQTNNGEGPSTWWKLTPYISEEKEILAGEIAEILFCQGVDLSKGRNHNLEGSDYNWSLIVEAKNFNLLILQEKLKKLGYIF